MSITNQLNPHQRQAVEHQDGPLLVIAGAGAGKTKTIAHRIQHLIVSGVAPEAILAITFTNKAAGEMRERVNNLLALGSELGAMPFVSTFHALGVYILRENSRATNIRRQFSILDKEDSLAQIKEAIKLLGFDPKSIEPRRVLNTISRAKSAGVTLSDYRESAQNNHLANLTLQIWEKYQAQLATMQALDFDDLLLKSVQLLRSRPEISKLYQDRWRYLHIDEYQDTNVIQYQLAKLLVGPAENICVVGDVDQSIYAWRGADFRNLLRFEQDYPKATVVLLEQNYRSTQTILQAANTVIAKNQQRHDKKLFTKNGRGERIGLLNGFDENDEADAVVARAQSIIGSGVPSSEIAVLYRTNFQSRAIEEACLSREIPYQILGTRFFERKEVKDVLAFIKSAQNRDDIVSLRRIINLPPRGVGKASLAKFASGGIEGLPSAMQKKIREFEKALDEIGEAAKTLAPSALIKFVIERSGLATWLREGGEDDLERLANIGELASVASKYDYLSPEEGIEKLLTEAALVSDQDNLEENKKGVRLMTVHAAKGLEFRYVFVVGLEQGLFPSLRLDTDSLRDPEEERRLFYVAITRAKEKLFLSWAETRNLWGSRQVNSPSDFLADIDEELIETMPTIYAD